MKTEEIKEVLPQREPMLMVDDILEVVPGEKAVGYKKIREDEFWAKGHFPRNPIFPGVLLIEHMAQVGLFLIRYGKKDKIRNIYLAKVEDMKFLSPVLPGMGLYTEVKKKTEVGNLVQLTGICYTDGEKKRKAASGKLICYLETEE